MNDIFLFFVSGLPVTCVMIVAAFFLRFLLRKQSKRLVNIIWIFLLLRLLCPISVESEFGIIPQKIMLSEEIFVPFNRLYDTTDTEEYKGADAMGIAVSGGAEDIEKGSSPQEKTGFQLEVLFMKIWWIGFSFMLLYTALNMAFIREKQHFAVRVWAYKNVYRWKDQTAPCVIGVIHPKIYVPAHLEKSELDMVIRHENAHIQRKDYLFILLYYVALCIYWFNPLCWLLYRRVQTDIEIACDEQVLLEAGVEERQTYSRVLLHLSTGKTLKADWMLSFGKGSLRKRIENIGHPQKYNKLIAVLSVVACAMAVLIGGV